MTTARSAMTTPGDAELLSRMARGELHALGILFDRYEHVVKRFMGRLGVPPPDVDDLVQLTFLDLPGAASRFDARSPFRSWLLGLAAVVVRRYRRSARRSAARLVAWASEPWRHPFPRPDDDFERLEATARALSALQKLSHKKREVFVMLVFEDLSGADAAQALGVPVATVWTRMHHARRDLRRYLKGQAK
jgi:RNA polymerase sigma-70 factor (ECF subfamily)